MTQLHDRGAKPATQRPLFVMGAGGHAVSVASVAVAAGFPLHGFVDAARGGGTLLGYPIHARIEDLPPAAPFACAIAIGDNSTRERVFERLREQHPGLEYPALIHPSAVVSAFTRIGDGTVVMPQACIGPSSTIGRFCIVNTSASIDHDGAMADFASLAPGAVTGGAVRIGLRSAVSIGAVVKHGVEIGDDSVLGANSYLNKPLPVGSVAYGSPARVVRNRTRDDAYLK